MKRWNKNTPEGTRDLLYKASRKKAKIEHALESLFYAHAFSGVMTPSFEFYDVFTMGGDVLEAENMYKLVDRHGRLIVMRADNTAPIVRLAQTRLGEETLPLRFSYTQNVFRANYGLNGARHEITQSGVELIGAGGIKADTEMLALAIDAMKECGVKGFKLEIGSVSFFKALTHDLPISEEELESIRALIEAKNFAALGDRLEKYRHLDKAFLALTALPQLFGGEEVFKKAGEIAYNDEAKEVLAYLEELCDRLQAMGLGEYVIFDLGMVQRLHYYTGLVFRAFTVGSGDAILSGGRYDTLAGNFGRTLEAVGFAVDVDSVLDVAMEHDQSVSPDRADVLLFYTAPFVKKAFDTADSVRKAGKICEMSPFDTVEESISYAKERGIPLVYEIAESPKEIAV